MNRIIHHLDLEKGLRKLNPDIHVFANSADEVSYFGGNENRTSIVYKATHVCNIDRGDIPERDVMTNVQTYMRPVRVEEALGHLEDVRIQALPFSDDQPFYRQLDALMGTRTDGPVVFPDGKQCYLYRSEGAGHKWINCCYFFRPTEAPHHVEKMGWRRIFKMLMDANIPGITKATLEKQFNVDLSERMSEVE